MSKKFVLSLVLVALFAAIAVSSAQARASDPKATAQEFVPDTPTLLTYTVGGEKYQLYCRVEPATTWHCFQSSPFSVNPSAEYGLREFAYGPGVKFYATKGPGNWDFEELICSGDTVVPGNPAKNCHRPAGK